MTGRHRSLERVPGFLRLGDRRMISQATKYEIEAAVDRAIAGGFSIEAGRWWRVPKVINHQATEVAEAPCGGCLITAAAVGMTDVGDEGKKVSLALTIERGCLGVEVNGVDGSLWFGELLLGGRERGPQGACGIAWAFITGFDEGPIDDEEDFVESYDFDADELEAARYGAELREKYDVTS